MTELLKTVLFDKHQELDATIVEFGGWECPFNILPASFMNIWQPEKKRASLMCRTWEDCFSRERTRCLYLGPFNGKRSCTHRTGCTGHLTA